MYQNKACIRQLSYTNSFFNRRKTQITDTTTHNAMYPMTLHNLNTLFEVDIIQIFSKKQNMIIYQDCFLKSSFRVTNQKLVMILLCTFQYLDTIIAIKSFHLAEETDKELGLQ